MAKKIITTAKVKKKKWYPIVATKGFNETILGESYLTEAAKLNNKFVTANLSTITSNFRDQNVNLTFKIVNVKDNRGHTFLVAYNILPSFIKRFVRRDKSKVADSFIVKDKDNNKVRVKPLVITGNVATKSQKTLIRKTVRNFTKTYFEKITLDDFVNSLIKKDFQRKLKSTLKKVMPIRHAEIRKVTYNDLKFKNFKKQDIVDEAVVDEIKKEDAEVEKEIVKKETKAEPKPEVTKKPEEVKIEAEVPKAEVKEAPVEVPKEEIVTEEVKK